MTLLPGPSIWYYYNLLKRDLFHNENNLPQLSHIDKETVYSYWTKVLFPQMGWETWGLKPRHIKY